MRVLVIGSSGFIGRHLTAELTSRGHGLVATSLSGRLGPCLDVADVDSCCRVIEAVAPEVVVNLAGAGVTAGSASDEDMVRTNSDGPTNVARAGVRCGARIVHVGSSTEPLLGMPAESFYSLTKAEGTVRIAKLMSANPRSITVARVHNAYGPGQPRGRFIIDLVKAVSAGKELQVRFPDRIRDFCEVGDVVRALSDLIEDPATSDRSFDIGTGTGTSLREAALLVQEIFGVRGGRVRLAGGAAADPARSSVAGDAGMEIVPCGTTLLNGLTMLARRGNP